MANNQRRRGATGSVESGAQTTTSKPPPGGPFRFSDDPASWENRGYFQPIPYTLTRNANTDEMDAFIRAERLLRRIDQQSFRIGLMRRPKLPGEHKGGITESIERILFLVPEMITDRNRADEDHIQKNLSLSAQDIRQYLKMFLEQTSDPKELSKALSAVEAHVIDTVLKARIHSLMQIAFWFVLIFIALFGALWGMANSGLLTPDESAFFGFWNQVKVFSPLAIGVFSGRFLSLFISKPSARGTFDKFYEVERKFETPLSDILADSFVAFCATILFVSGIIVIGVGDIPMREAAESGGSAPASLSAINTLGVASSWQLAMGFGILIGLARAQFLGRIRGLAEETVA